ncbi:MAG: carboxymuconolactone decarboxylase family protein [bacterium]
MSAVLDTLDAPTATLVRLAAVIAAGDDAAVRTAFTSAVDLPPVWVDELVLQTQLFSGFPRALNAAREWRQVAPAPAPVADESDEQDRLAFWQARGEETCAAVYGPMYERLRATVRQLHPALDAAMLVEGYGRILGRPGLDLPRRELCIVAACAVTGQDRQLHSHLHGALNVGVAPAVLTAAVGVLAPLLGADRTKSVQLLLARVVGK